MGFTQSVIVSSPVGPESKQAILTAALERWPFLRLPVRDWLLPAHAQVAPPELTEYLFREEEDYEQAVERNGEVEDGSPEWSRQFPQVAFAFVSADCFGGTCLYSGYFARSGEVVARARPDYLGHIQLLDHVGIHLKDSHFDSFRRGYFGHRRS